MRKMASANKGITHKMTNASLGLSTKAMISARSASQAPQGHTQQHLDHILDLVISLVNRVIKEPGLYWSIFLKENL